METTKKAKKSFFILLLILLIGGICGTAFAGPKVIYVDADATGANNGTSWKDAYNYLQDALLAARNCGCNEIKVAQGIYRPDEDATHPDGNNSRYAAFQLKNGVEIKGGYAGFGEPDPNARNIEQYETILSGEIGTAGNNSDNSYHVVTGSGTTDTAVLDGFCVTDGNANGADPGGGGMYNYYGSPKVTNCAFSGNSTYSDGACGTADGGGMYNKNSSPTVTNCTFNGNSAECEAYYYGCYSTAANGGGMYNYDSSPTVTNCTFSGNLAGWGGGIGDYNSNPTVTNCTFSGNSAFYDGGGMHNDYSSPTVTNCTFTGNSAGGCGSGGGMYNYSGSPTVTNCTFERNVACADGQGGGVGGGMCNDESSPIIANCTFSENSAIDWYMCGTGGGGIFNYLSGGLITNCMFIGNSSNDGGGIYTEGGLITNCTFIGNWVLKHQVIGEEQYLIACGGGMCGSGTVTNCTFIGNSAFGIGGGMCNWGGKVTNCVFSGNLAYAYEEVTGSGPVACGGGIYSDGGIITNCTFSRNLAYSDIYSGYGGGMFICHDGDISNCILWGDTAKTNGNEIALYGWSTIDINYCDVKGGQEDVYIEPNCVLNWGSGNIDADPCFVNADNNDFHLDFNSRCIDAGNNTVVPVGIDLDGHHRFVDDPCTADTGNGTPPIVDMGAYEYRLGPIIYKVSVNAGDCVEPGYEVNYRIDYNYPNWNKPDINDVNIIDMLPDEVEFVLSVPEPNEIIDSNIIWHIGTLHPGDAGFVTLKVRVKGSVSQCGSIRNRCELRSGEQILSSTSEYTAVCVENSFVVDNFNSYADTTALRKVWKDYWTQPAPRTRAVVFTVVAPNRGGQSMQYLYENDLSPYYSEVRADVNTARPNGLGIDPNWLGMGAKSLVLWFFGLPLNPLDEEMYIKLTDGAGVNGKVKYPPSDMNDIREPEWHQWNIDLQDFVGHPNNVNLADVNVITIGFGDGLPAGAYDGISDVVYFEDIQLCVPASDPADGAKCVPQEQVLSWTPGACAATQDVYFSHIFNDVNTMQPAAFKGNVPVGTMTYDPVPDMNVYTLYYWRIVEKNVCNETTIGPVWCLATGAAVVSGVQKPCCNNEPGNCLGNINTDTGVNLTDYGLLVNFITPLPSNRCFTSAGSPTCPPCYDINGSGRVDVTDLGELVNKLSIWTNQRHTCPYPSCSNP